MKSFGVRLAAGAITILFGAYAAALAQKDKQDKSDAWTANPPSLGEPVSPIADMSNESWLSQPTTDSEGSDENESVFAPEGAIQLVQHVEPVPGESNDSSAPAFDPSVLPATLGGDVSDSGAGNDALPTTADWALPTEAEPSADAAGAAAAAPALTMTFPAGGISDPGTPAQPADPTALGNPQAGSPAVGSPLPEAQLGQGPAMDVFPGQTPELRAEASPIGSDGQPQNLLRGADPSVNALRSGDGLSVPGADAAGPGAFGGPTATLSAPTPNDAGAAAPSFGAPSFGTPSGPATNPRDIAGAAATGLAAGVAAGGAAALAQNAPGFGQSAQQFDQPTQMQPSQLSGQLQPAGAPGFGGPASLSAPPTGQDRMASLPRDNGLAPGFAAPAQPNAMSQPNGAVAIDPNATVDAPGDRRLEGAQTPSVIIQKRAPSEVKVGKPASFVIHVQNVGAVEALDVVVHDRIPAGMRLIDASPAPVQQGNMLVWQLGAMPAGDERTVTMQLVAEQEGELGSVARVSFEAAASVRTISTRPELKIVQTAPETVLIGQQLEIGLEVSNPGSGEATNVVLQEDVPEGLEHPKGRQLDNAMGTLAPGEKRNQVLRLRAVAPGIIQNTIRLTGDDGLTAEHTVAVQVVSPNLQVELGGPARRFLERPATYNLNFANTGTADATNVEFAIQLDRGFTFVSTDNEGQYDPSRHAVFWELAQLPAGGTGSVPLTLLPVQEGEQAIVIDARADLGIVAKNEKKILVEGFAELSFAVNNPGGPIELGAETTYEVRVTNSGSKPDSNVRVQLQLPPGLELISADTEAGSDGRGLVAFQPRAQLMPGDEVKYGLRLRGVAPGTHIVKAIVVSNQSAVPVTKEESTLVYADQ